MTRLHLCAGMLLSVFTLNGAVAGDGLGRLFTSEPERTQLDAGGESETNVSETTPSAHQSDEKIKLAGTLVSSRGQRKVWLDDHDGDPTSDTTRSRIVDAGHVRVEDADGVYRSVRPGQVLDTGAGKVFESFQVTADPGAGAEQARQ